MITSEGREIGLDTKSGDKSRGKFICFTGIDGSGKTLQAERLVESLKARGIPCVYTWCRYNPRILKPLNDLAKLLIGRRKGGSEYSGYTSSKKGIFRKPVIGWIWLNISLLEYLRQARSCITKLMRVGANLVCDRYLYDMLADVAINFDHNDDRLMQLTRHPVVRRFPKPDMVFFLDVPPEVAWARKQDPVLKGQQYVVDRAEVYSALCDSLGFIRIDGTKSIEEIADDILEHCATLIEGASSEAET